MVHSQKLRGTELLGGLERGVLKLAHDPNTIGVHIQPEFDDVDLRNRDWLPSVLGVGATTMIRFHWLSAVAHPCSLANTHVIFTSRPSHGSGICSEPCSRDSNEPRSERPK